MNLVVVESPAKAKTINKYLGDDYIVLASYGHIRDLPSKNGSVNPDNNFQMEWEVDSFSKKYLKEITDAAKINDSRRINIIIISIYVVNNSINVGNNVALFCNICNPNCKMVEAVSPL